MKLKRRRNVKKPPSKNDLLNDLYINIEYLKDDNAVNWGGSEMGQEKESINNHIKWLKRKLKETYNVSA